MKLVMDVCDEGIRRMRVASRRELRRISYGASCMKRISRTMVMDRMPIAEFGPRTNPWVPECGTRVIQAGDVVALILTWLARSDTLRISQGHGFVGQAASDRQRRLYEIAQEQIRSISHCWSGRRIPASSRRRHEYTDPYVPQRYLSPIHVLAWSMIPGNSLSARLLKGSRLRLVRNMVVSVESYVGEVGALKTVSNWKSRTDYRQRACPVEFRDYDAIEVSG